MGIANIAFRFRIKLCDFGISGRLVDSKARTRSAGCAAYMAPERIDPPNPSKPDYDIRADVWSLGITLVELATGHFPYRDCRTDFEVLTKVLTDDPPLLPRNQGFSIEFCSFVRDCLMKNYKDRPKYKKLLLHPFIQRYERERVDVGAWYRSHMKNLEGGGAQSNSQTSAAVTAAAQSSSSSAAGVASGAAVAPDTLSLASDKSFKPQPSPRVARSWRPPPPVAVTSSSTSPQSPPQAASASASSSSPASYPSAITSSRRTMATSDALDKRDRSRGAVGHHYSAYIGGGVGGGDDHPPPVVTGGARLASASATAASPYEHRYQQQYAANGDRGAPPSAFPTSVFSSPYVSRSSRALYGGGSGGGDRGVTQVSSSSASGPRSLDEERSLRTARYGTYCARESPHTSRKNFDFTYPTTLPASATYHSDAASHLYHQYRTGTAGNHADRERRRQQQQQQQQHSDSDPHLQQHRPEVRRHHDAMQRSAAASMRDSGPASAPYSYVTSSDRIGRSTQQQQQQQQQQQRSPSQDTGRTSYFPSWRAISQWNFQSPLSLRRLRTASTDRGVAAFDAARRFQPSYRSWNEKDGGGGGGNSSAADPGPNYHGSSRR